MDGEESAATRSSTEVTSAARGGGLILRGDGRRIIGAELGGCEVLGAADDGAGDTQPGHISRAHAAGRAQRMQLVANTQLLGDDIGHQGRGRLREIFTGYAASILRAYSTPSQ